MLPHNLEDRLLINRYLYFVGHIQELKRDLTSEEVDDFIIHYNLYDNIKWVDGCLIATSWWFGDPSDEYPFHTPVFIGKEETPRRLTDHVITITPQVVYVKNILDPLITLTLLLENNPYNMETLKKWANPS